MSNSPDLHNNTSRGNVGLHGGANTIGSLKDYLPFFGNDPKGAMYVQAAYVKGVYNQPINPQLPNLPTLLEVIATGEAKNNVNPQYTHCIQPDFVSLVINTALCHASIDKSVGRYEKASQNTANLRNVLYNPSFTQGMNNTLKTNGGFAGLNPRQGSSWLEILKDAEDIYDNDFSQVNGNNLLQVYKELCVFLARSQGFLCTGGAATFIRANLKPQLTGNLTQDIQNEILIEVFKLLEEKGSNTTLSDDVANRFYSEVFGKWKSLGEDARDFYSQNLMLLQLVNGRWVPFNDYENIPPNRSNFRINLKKNRGGTIFEYSLPFISQKYGAVILPGGQIIPLGNSQTDKTILKDLYYHVYTNGSNYRSTGAVDYLQPNFAQPNFIPPQTGPTYPPLPGPDRIPRRVGPLRPPRPDAPGDAVGDVVGDATGDAVGDAAGDAAGVHLPDAAGEEEVLGGGAQPQLYIPPFVHNGTQYTIDLASLYRPDFNFNPVKLNLKLQTTVVELARSFKTPVDSEPLEALFPPSSSNAQWKRDANANYFTYDPVTNKRVYPTGNMGYCSAGDDNCKRFFECVLNDKYDEIGRCLKDLLQEDVLSNIKRLISTNQILPDDLIRILKKFGVRRKDSHHERYGKIVVPQTFNEWKQFNRLPKEIFDSILQSRPLQDLIRAGIDALTTNISIMNPQIRDHHNSSYMPTGDPRFIHLKIPLYKVPEYKTTSGTMASADILTRSYFPSLPFIMPPPQSTPFGGPPFMGMAMGMGNRMMGGAANKVTEMPSVIEIGGMTLSPFVLTPPMALVGGGSCVIPSQGSGNSLFGIAIAQARKSIRSSSLALKNVFTGVLNEMKANGKILDPNDENKIKVALKKYETMEETLIETYVHLYAYSWLLRMFNNGMIPCEGGDQIVRLEDVLDKESMNRYFASEIARAQQSIQSTLLSRGHLMGELGGRILPDLLRVSNGQSTDSVVAVDRSTGELGVVV
jgi:hypothetical protein